MEDPSISIYRISLNLRYVNISTAGAIQISSNRYVDRRVLGRSTNQIEYLLSLSPNALQISLSHGVVRLAKNHQNLRCRTEAHTNRSSRRSSLLEFVHRIMSMYHLTFHPLPRKIRGSICTSAPTLQCRKRSSRVFISSHRHTKSGRQMAVV